jgi:UDP-N-acetylmuramate--alanine ligase
MKKLVYFLGIGGIGMSALARYFRHAGAFVAGYDRCPSPLTAALEQEGIPVHYDDNPSAIPAAVLEQPAATLVIYTPALPSDHKELAFLQEQGYHIIKRSKALGEIAATKHCLAVAGTHGKTTTSTLLAHIFAHSGAGCTAFLGGISKNYQSNLLLSHSPWLVAEADEFDRSFLQLHPQKAIITATDADHLDIYGTAQAFSQAFVDFATQIQPGGALVLKAGIDLPLPADRPYSLYRYALDQVLDFYADALQVQEDGCYNFTLHLQDIQLPLCHLGIPGLVNVENAVAAAALAFLSGIPPQSIANALTAFRGVARRFDIQYNHKGRLYIDDYAHHPTEIRAALGSIRKMFPGRSITAIFQPHLYSRTRDFAQAFGDSLSLADKLILLPIYPAREEPIEGISSEMLLEKVTILQKIFVNKDKLLPCLRQQPIDILVSLGAGDIDRFVPQIVKLLEETAA